MINILGQQCRSTRDDLVSEAQRPLSLPPSDNGLTSCIRGASVIIIMVNSAHDEQVWRQMKRQWPRHAIIKQEATSSELRECLPEWTFMTPAWYLLLADRSHHVVRFARGETHRQNNLYFIVNMILSTDLRWCTRSASRLLSHSIWQAKKQGTETGITGILNAYRPGSVPRARMWSGCFITQNLSSNFCAFVQLLNLPRDCYHPLYSLSFHVFPSNTSACHRD